MRRQYGGQPPGACNGFICRIDLATGTATPISDALPDPATTVSVVEVAIARPDVVLALAVWSTFDEESGIVTQTGTLLRLDVATGALTTVASAIPISITVFTYGPRPELVATPSGDAYLTTQAGILSVAPDGTVALLAPAPSEEDLYRGLALESADALLTTAPGCAPVLGCGAAQFVRIALATGAATPLDEGVWPTVEQLVIAPNGDRFGFDRTSVNSDGEVWHWTPAGLDVLPLAWGETYQHSVTGIAAALNGTLFVAANGHPEFLYALPEIQRFSPTGLIAAFDLDFFVQAIGVAPVFQECSDGIDNDGDGAIDHPADAGCQGATSTNESPKCDDGVDNDGDGRTDWDGAGASAPDPECQGDGWRNREQVACGVGAELLLLLPLLRRVRARSRATVIPRLPRP
jgi:hypothetical protein